MLYTTVALSATTALRNLLHDEGNTSRAYDNNTYYSIHVISEPHLVPHYLSGTTLLL